MNFQAKNKKPTWQKIAGTVLVVVIALGYLYVDYQKKQANNNGGNQASQGDGEMFGGLERPNIDLGGNKDSGKESNVASLDSFFKPGSRNSLRSPGGLLYVVARSGEHRRDHVLRHAEDQPNRPVHSVFEGDPVSIFKSIDEAYGLIQSKSKKVSHRFNDKNKCDEYTIDMGRKIGYEGGQKGKRKGFPALSKIRLIIQDDRVITAYPYR